MGKKSFAEFALVLAEQGFRSGATLCLSIFLGRALDPTDYGIYTLLFSTAIVLLAIQNGLSSTPLVTLLHDRSDDEKEGFLGNMLVIHLSISLVLLIVAGIWRIVGGYLSDNILYHHNTLMIFALSMAAWFLKDFVRQVMLSTLAVKEMALFGIVINGATIISVLVLYFSKSLTLFYAYMVITVTSLVPSIAYLVSRRIRFQIRTLKRDFKESQRVGKWLMGRAFLNIISGSLILNSRLAATHGFEQVGLYGACIVPSTLLNPISQSLISYMLPKITITLKDGKDSLKILIKKFNLMLLIPLFFFNIIIFLGTETIMKLIFGGKYDVKPLLLLLFTLQSSIILYAIPVNTALVAMKKVKSGFLGEAIAAAIVVLVGIPIVTAWGVWGVAVTLLASTLANRGYQIYDYNKSFT